MSCPAYGLTQPAIRLEFSRYSKQQSLGTHLRTKLTNEKANGSEQRCGGNTPSTCSCTKSTAGAVSPLPASQKVPRALDRCVKPCRRFQGQVHVPLSQATERAQSLPRINIAPLSSPIEKVLREQQRVDVDAATWAQPQAGGIPFRGGNDSRNTENL